MLPPDVAPRPVEDPEALAKALAQQAIIEAFSQHQHEHDKPCTNMGSENCSKQSAEKKHLSWFGTRILRGYLSSLNLCLSQLGWVPRSIVEVGCGNGLFLGHVGKYFADSVEFTVKGLDTDDALIERAQQDNCCRIEFERLTPGQSIPLADNSVDLVISHAFLAQTPMAQHWLNECCRISAEGVIIALPQPKLVQAFKMLPQSWFKDFPWHRGAFLTQPSNPSVSPATLRAWLTQQGFKTEVVLSPMPYTMVMARKPQAKKK